MKFYRLSEATFYDRIYTIYSFIKPFLDKKMSIFGEYEAFNAGTTKSKWPIVQTLIYSLI